MWIARIGGAADFHGSFLVARYERPRLSLEAVPSSTVVYRGDKISGVLRVRYFFGEPAVGKPVEYRVVLPDGAVVEKRGVTNAAGEVAFELDTTEFSEEALAVPGGPRGRGERLDAAGRSGGHDRVRAARLDGAGRLSGR